ncbi:MAG: PEGA domain-containing protein [Vulcanimicrobiota bacterium]
MKVEIETPAGTILKVWSAFLSLFWYFFLLIGLIFLVLTPLVGLGVLKTGKLLYGTNDTLRYFASGLTTGLLALLGSRANDWLWYDEATRKKLQNVADKVAFGTHELAALLILFVGGPSYLAFWLHTMLKQLQGLSGNSGPVTRLLPAGPAALFSRVGLVCGCLWLTTTLYAYVHYPLVNFETRPPAKITVDGQELGVSPLTHPLTVGTHRLKLELKNQPPDEIDLQVPMGGLTFTKRIRAK